MQSHHHPQPSIPKAQPTQAPNLPPTEESLISGVRALDVFVRHLAKGYRLTVGETGLLVRSETGGFVRYNRGNMGLDRPIFIRADPAPGDASAERIRHNIELELKGVERATELYCNMKEMPALREKFDVIESDDSIYIQVNPFIKSGEFLHDFYTMVSRGKFIRGGGFAVGTAVGAEGLIHFNGDWKSFLKLGALIYYAPRLQRFGLRYARDFIYDRNPFLAIDKSEEHFQALRDQFAEQLLGDNKDGRGS